MVVGLTGGVASGKSTVAKYLADLGATVIDADAVSAAVLAEQGKALVSLFGAAVLRPDGRPDKVFLKQQVFADANKRKQLEALLHPKIQAQIKSQVAGSHTALIVVELPLLVEAGWQEMFDQIWVVEVGLATQKARLLARDGMSEELADQMIASQIDNQTRRQYADVVIENNANKAALQAHIQALYMKAVN